MKLLIDAIFLYSKETMGANKVACVHFRHALYLIEQLSVYTIKTKHSGRMIKMTNDIFCPTPVVGTVELSLVCDF